MSGKRFLLFVLLAINSVLTLTSASVEIKIFFTTDTHAVFYSPSGGWLKLAGLIKEQTADRSDCLLIDCGDTMQGNIEGAFDRGRAAIKTLNHLKFDVWVVGNHDTEFGFKALRKRIKEFNGFCLAGNLFIPDGQEQLSGVKIFERKGLKIAVIGLTLPNMQDDVRLPSSLAGKSEGIIESLNRIIPKLRPAKPDIIILAMHCDKFRSGFSIYELSRQFPEIALILGGHSHQSSPGENIGSSWYVQTSSYAQELGKINIAFDPKEQRIIQIKSELLPIPPDATVDKELNKLLSHDLRQVNVFKKQIVGKAKTTIAGYDENRRFAHPAGMLTAKSMIAATGAQAALLSMNSPYELRGDISELDIFRIMPYENTVAVIDVTIPELELILKEQIANSRKYYTPVFYGFKVEFNPQNSAIKISRHDSGKITSPIKLALTNYLLISRRFPELQKIAARQPLQQLPSEEPLLRDCMRNWIRNNSPLTPDNGEWLTIIK